MWKSLERAMPALALALTGAALGGILVTRARTRQRPVTVQSRITVLASVEQAWLEWAPLVTLPRFLKHVDRVEDLGQGRSRWTAHLTKGGPPLIWEAQELERVEESVIRWRTIDGQPLHTEGEVRFDVDNTGRGTVVRLKLTFAPGSSTAQLAASFLKGIPKQLARAELRRFKAFLETGEVPTIEGQPSGREPILPLARRPLGDIAQQPAQA